MTVNLLSQRLKVVKRELTALKTAHMRGLGNVKVYKQRVDVPQDGHTGVHDITVTVTLDNTYAAYPYVDLYPVADTNNNHSMEVDSVFYQNEYTIIFKLLWLYKAGTNAFYVASSSPIANINYTWD